MEKTIKDWANELNKSTDEIIALLAHVGVHGKSEKDQLDGQEKMKLVGALSLGSSAPTRLTTRRVTQSVVIKQDNRSSRNSTTTSHTVRVSVKKKRVIPPVKKPILTKTAVEDNKKQNIDSKDQIKSDTKESTPKIKKTSVGTVSEKEDTKAKIKKHKDEPVVDKTLNQETIDNSEKDLGLDDEALLIQLELEAEAVMKESARAEEKALLVEKEAKTTASTADSIKPRDDAKKKTSRKNKKDRRRGDREELHAAKRDKSEMSYKLGRSRNIKSSISDKHAFARPTAPVVHDVKIPETISVADLARAMSIKSAEILRVLMNMGVVATINQTLDQDTAVLAVEELGHTATPVDLIDKAESILLEEFKDIESLPRSPVVTVLGHVDHGKTSLLDSLRKTNIVSGEAGKITQHIGAYKVKVKDSHICFLDTPGHEAFSAMRSRGTKATDIAILVVAANDGIKPQTIEAISHAKNSKVPIVVAINKIDLPDTDIDHIKNDLLTHEIIIEDFGGEVPTCLISALTGEGLDALIETIMLQAEILELTARPTGNAVGVVIESKIDKGKGVLCTVLVQEGQLKKGDSILVGKESGRIRSMSDENGKALSTAGPSTPVEIQGLSGVPYAGEDFVVTKDERTAREIALHRQGKYKDLKSSKRLTSAADLFNKQAEETDQSTLNLVLKTDVYGSLDALRTSLENLSNDNARVKVIHGMVGGINESDATLAEAAGARIIAFNVRADATARKLIEKMKIPIHHCSVIYEAIDIIKTLADNDLGVTEKEREVGLFEVKEVFRNSKLGAVAGGKVVRGSVKRDLPVRVLRENVVIFEGKIFSLRRIKDNVSEVKQGYECGVGIQNYRDIKIGDQIEVFELA